MTHKEYNKGTSTGALTGYGAVGNGTGSCSYKLDWKPQLNPQFKPGKENGKPRPETIRK